MDRPLPRKVLILLVGALLAMGASFSAVQAGGMPGPDCASEAPGMVLASDMDISDESGCDACGDGAATAHAAPCPAPCPAFTLATLPSAGLPRTNDTGLPAPVAGPPVHGAAFAPDPHPPRPLV